MTTERGAPPITEELRAQARANPGGWLYAIAPGYDPDGAVPPEGIVGAWQIDDGGEIVGEFQHNPNHRP